MAIRAISFDFWGTLFYFDNTPGPRKALRVKAFCEAAPTVQPEAVADALDAAAEAFLRVHIEEQRTLDPIDAVQMLSHALRVTLSDESAARVAERFATVVIDYPPVPIQDALEAVQAAAARVPIGLISDTGLSPGSSLKVVMDQQDFTEHFKALTFSDEMGVSKPQAVMFESTAKALGVETHELLHIGDLEPTDIAGIQQLGGTAGLFTGVNDRFQDSTQAEHTFPDWKAFIARLPELT